MFLKESTVFMSIGLPIAILYILIIISSLENKKVHIRLRDVCISVIALDVYKLASLLERGDKLSGFTGIYPMLTLCISLLIIHILLTLKIRKILHPSNAFKINKKFTLIRDIYIGISLLMSNAVSIAALIEIAGGINQ
ncbi:hypothetical protein ACEU0D_004245 [Enterobacter ludwigii]|uniref:hypothetical protein n=2 Tax=Enterobacter cloacae complex TaxID=354276 RepID=UPI00372F47E3|nr:hypothetical protein [Enterobacter ludwigii]